MDFDWGGAAESILIYGNGKLEDDYFSGRWFTDLPEANRPPDN